MLKFFTTISISSRFIVDFEKHCMTLNNHFVYDLIFLSGRSHNSTSKSMMNQKHGIRLATLRENKYPCQAY